MSSASWRTTHLVDEQKPGREIDPQPPLQAVLGMCTPQVVSCDEVGSHALRGGFQGQCYGQVGFPHTRRAKEDHVLAVGNEPERRKAAHLSLVQTGLSGLSESLTTTVNSTPDSSTSPAGMSALQEIEVGLRLVKGQMGQTCTGPEVALMAGGKLFLEDVTDHCECGQVLAGTHVQATIKHSGGLSETEVLQLPIIIDPYAVIVNIISPIFLISPPLKYVNSA